MQRPELLYGAYEFKAPSTYSVRPPLLPAFCFVIDVSTQALQSGLFTQVV